MKLRVRNRETVYYEGNSRKKRKVLTALNCFSDLVKLSESDTLYKNIDTRGLQRISTHLKKLDDLVGMKDLKETIFYQILYYIQGFGADSEDYMHTVIYGEPGCGKTEVSKILGEIYSGLGLLSENKFRIATRSDLIGQYLGETSIKTTSVLEESLGGVLFIDEVYSLGNEDGRDFYVKECIDTINLFLSENKHDFCLIIAGYEDDIEKCFFSRNKGLKRRFPWVHRIDKYSEDELVEIMRRMVGYTTFKLDCSNEFLRTLIKENKEVFKYFAGSIENLLSKAKIYHSKRVFGLDKKFHFLLNEDDIKTAVKELKKNEKKKETSNFERMFL